MPARTWRRITATTRSTTTASATGATAYAATDRGLATSAADTFMYEDAAAHTKDEDPLGPGGLARPGQAEREQREHDHQQVQQQRLDHAGRVLPADGEDIGVLGAERDEQCPAADQRQQPRRHRNQHRPRDASGPGPAARAGVEPLAGLGSGAAHDRLRRSASRDRTRLTDVAARPNARPIAAMVDPAAAAAAIASSRSRRAAAVR